LREVSNSFGVIGHKVKKKLRGPNKKNKKSIGPIFQNSGCACAHHFGTLVLPLHVIFLEIICT